jgi:uncharacterized membrane protein
MAALVIGSFLSSPRIRREVRLMDRRGTIWYLVAGLLAALAQIFRFFALSEGDVTLVVLIMQVVPLFVIFLTIAINRDFEALNAYVLLGGVFVTAGAVIVTAWT